MNKYFSLIRKEFLLLIRDVPGLIILFIMPALLVMVISIAQVNTVKYSSQSKMPLLLVNNSGSGFSKEIEKSITGSGFFDRVTNLNGKRLTRHIADSLVEKGEYQSALILEANDAGMILLLDPADADVYNPGRIRSLENLVAGTRQRLAATEALKGMIPLGDKFADKVIRSAMKKMAPVTVRYAEKDRASIRPSVTQNNIPGYIIFSMFLIVIPVAGNMVNEKRSGYRTRCMTLRVTMPVQIYAKISIFITICVIQFLLMFLAGWFTFPGFSGYLAIRPSIQYPLLVVSVITAALGATGFGILVGSVSSTHGQAALLGPFLVVILAALSGSFFPVYLMPWWMREISVYSPLSWGIENFSTVFFRQGAVASILLHTCLLLFFFIFTVAASVLILKRSYRV